MSDHFYAVAEAFSRKARIYDAFGEDHHNLTRMRQKVYAHIEALLSPGSTILELNAGTGFDAVTLAGKGYHVHATDIAPGMLAQIQDKIRRYHLEDQISVQPCSFTELDNITLGPFDGITSNFGGLNCINDLSLITRQLPHLLKPGGVVVWVIMPPICLWELIRIPQDFRMATRRLKRRNVVSNVEGVKFLASYFTPKEVKSAFGPEFRLLRVEGLSVLTPPADNKTFARRFPRLYHALVSLDDFASRWPLFRAWGDFFILAMRYQPTDRS
jgi:ubiquinone/menaquinone biosynthesis C-methylase UbiE